jgi:hypothetical protein
VLKHPGSAARGERQPHDIVIILQPAIHWRANLTGDVIKWKLCWKKFASCLYKPHSVAYQSQAVAS